PYVPLFSQFDDTSTVTAHRVGADQSKEIAVRSSLLRARVAGVVAVAAVMAGVVNAAPSSAANSLSMLGADVSSLQRSNDLGVKYYDANGYQKDPLDILRGVGMNYVRLRVFNNPASGYNNPSKVFSYAKSVKSRGLKLLVDLHYSDTWADPGNQWK